MTATALEMLGEVVAVVRKRGLDPKPFIDVLTSTMFGGRAHKLYGDKIVKQTYAPGFVLPLVLKDVRLALAEAEKAGAPMPSVSVVRDRLITGIARGYADLDWTALGLIAAEEAGLTLAVPPASSGDRHPDGPAPSAPPTDDLTANAREGAEYGSSIRSCRNEHGICRHSGTSLKVSPRRYRHLGHWRLDVGWNRRS